MQLLVIGQQCQARDGFMGLLCAVQRQSFGSSVATAAASPKLQPIIFTLLFFLLLVCSHSGICFLFFFFTGEDERVGGLERMEGEREGGGEGAAAYSRR